MKAKAVEYVKICSLYGAGFYYIPGTDTCIKLGGYLRAEVALNTNSDFSGQSRPAANGARNRLTNYYTMRAREDLNIDTRTATEYGVVRTFFDGVFSWTTGNYAGTGSATGTTAYSGTLALNTSGATPALVGSRRSTAPTATPRPVRSACTTPSSSSPASPWVRPCRSSTRPGPTIPATTSTASSAVAARSPVSTSSPTPADFGQGITAAFSAEDATAYYQAGNLNMTGAAGCWCDRRLVWLQRHRRFAFAEPRRYGSRRPGLGSVPGVGRCA